jgi:hypothetical protein
MPILEAIKRKISGKPAGKPGSNGQGLPSKASGAQLKAELDFARDEKARLEREKREVQAIAAKEKELIEKAKAEEKIAQERQEAAMITNERADKIALGIGATAGAALATAKGVTFDQNMLRADYQAPTGTVTGIGGASVGAAIAGASLVMNGVSIANNAGDWSHADLARRRDARGEVKAGLRGAVINSVSSAQGAVAVSVAAGAITGAAVVAAPVLGVVAGGATMVRSGIRGVQAHRYEQRLRAIDQSGLGLLKESIDYSANQMAVRKKKMGVEVAAATLGTAGSIALGAAAIAGTAALMATPVGWVLASAAAAIGLGYLGYKIYRKLRKGTSGVLREEHADRIVNALINGDAAAQKAAGEVLTALGITSEINLSEEGRKHLTALVAKKIKSS